MPYSTTQTVSADQASLMRNIDTLKTSTPQGRRSERVDPTHLLRSPSFLEPRPLDHSTPIPEEDEDETSSEPAEAITPTSDSHPPFSHHGVDATGGLPPMTTPVKPLIINTAATPSPPSTRSRNPSTKPDKTSPTAGTASQQSKPHSRSLRSLFRRSNSNAVDQLKTGPFNLASSEPTAMALPRRKPAFSTSHSPVTSQSNSPPSPGSPASTLNGAADRNWGRPALNKSNQSSTGLNLRNVNIHFGSTPKPNHPRPHTRKRSTSVNAFNAVAAIPDAFSRPAATGAGLKARRMSINLPDDFVVDTVALDKEFTSASKLPGKRGKFIGKGATATVKLMTRKGNGDELYAVKEFRKRGQNEDPEEYDKKVKSEYTIAKSLHHPNIVESVRLCTHAGRWNVVMEYCHVGELFSLIEKKYLQLDDHLCLFKQLLRGVNYLHGHGIAHRDIKLENLLMNNKGHLKITDFGVSDVFCGEHPGLRGSGGECGKNMKDVRRCAPGICGSLPYIAPEVLEKKGDYDPRPLDVWSCAVVMLSMIFGGQPWSEASRSQPAYAKFAGSWDKLEANKAAGKVTDGCVPVDAGPMFKAIPKPALRALILKMMHPDPEKRIHIQDAVNEGWVKLIDCCAHDEIDGDSAKEIDASKKICGKAAKMVVTKSHHHQPPEKHWAPQHRFDMGQGWS